MSRRTISLISSNDILFYWVKKETEPFFIVHDFIDYISELKLFTAEESDCVFLDADSIPLLYLRILYRLYCSHSIPTVIVYKRKYLPLEVKRIFSEALFINGAHEKGKVLVRIMNFLEEIHAAHKEHFLIESQYSIERTSTFSPFLHVNSADTNSIDGAFDIFSGSSPKMQEFRRLVTEAAGNENIVLLTGESGTGKSYTAQYIHQHSVRGSRSMQFVNVADIVPTLAESEFFGVEKGAYTSAVVKQGLFEAAEQSTLFLDEIGELSPDLQTKLLDVIETKSFKRVGSTVRRNFDTRLIFATNADLQRKIQRGLFRKDLFYRIAVLTIEVPPLREHMEDIPLLAQTFVKTRNIASSAMEKLSSYSWPGNIRELKNVLYRADAFCHGEEIRADDISFY